MKQAIHLRPTSAGSSTSKVDWANGAAASAPPQKNGGPGWRNEAAFGGGGLYDWGSHFIDQLWQLFESDPGDAGSEVLRTGVFARPIRVFAQLRGNVWTKDCDDFAQSRASISTTAAAEWSRSTQRRPEPIAALAHRRNATDRHESPFSLEFDTHKWAELTFTSSIRRTIAGGFFLSRILD